MKGGILCTDTDTIIQTMDIITKIIAMEITGYG